MAATYESNEEKIDALISEYAAKLGELADYRKVQEIIIAESGEYDYISSTFAVVDLYRNGSIIHTDVYPIRVYELNGSRLGLPAINYSGGCSVSITSESKYRAVVQSGYTFKIRGYAYEPSGN